jgi:hypothetical protein
MKTVTASVDLPCTPDAFWRVFFDDEYTRTLYLEALGFKSVTILSKTENTRKILVSPKVNLPGPLAKLIGDAFAYEEHGTLDRASNVWSWRMVPPNGKRELVTTRGTTRIVSTGEKSCRRTDEVVTEGKVFGLGGLIESSVEKELHSSWSKEWPHLRRWIEKTQPT